MRGGLRPMKWRRRKSGLKDVRYLVIVSWVEVAGLAIDRYGAKNMAIITIYNT